MKKVLLLATGGTIACTHSEEGLTPGMSGDGILDWMPELREGFAIESRDILNLDSSNIQPEEWQFMAEQVAEALPDYDGIIITHGTDTMAYTASALSYMLQNLSKPVVLTGAQIPIGQDHGVSIAVCSQCLYEKSDLSLYEVGRKLLDCGVIPGRDMTTEAIVTKMMWALGQTEDPAEVKEIFARNYCGEVS